MGELVGAFPCLPYEERLEFLVKNRIALWDVCAAARRRGSLDSNIESPKANDFASFFEAHKKIEIICFNGQSAEKLFDKYVLPGFKPRQPRARLPSTSPAYASMRYEQKLARWREALFPFTEEQQPKKKPCR